MNPGLVLAFDDEQTQAQAMAAALGVPMALVARHHFPDGECKLRLPPDLPAQLLLLRGLHQPHHKLVELLITVPAARALGARQVLLVSPYLAYMRQDMAFTPGEAVSQRHIAALLASQVDGLITIDPHLHRIQSLDEVMPGCRSQALTAAPLLGAWVARQVPGTRPVRCPHGSGTGPLVRPGPWSSSVLRDRTAGREDLLCSRGRDPLHVDRELDAHVTRAEDLDRRALADSALRDEVLHRGASVNPLQQCDAVRKGK